MYKRQYNDSYGNYVVIKDSKGYELRYAYLSSRSVSAGASVTKGDEIGLVGNTGNSTGSHLHIELLKNGERLNPIFYLETGEGAGFGGNEYTRDVYKRQEVENEKGFHKSAKFVPAVRRNYSDEVSFIPVKAFAKKAEFARDYLMQGTKVIVELSLIHIFEKRKAAPQPWQVIAQRFCSTGI